MEWLTYVQQWYDGLISEAEMHANLDKLQIRGGIEATSKASSRYHGCKFVGYDYRRQMWLRVEMA